MTIRAKYISFVIIIHVLIIYLAFQLLREQKVLFILSELLILISLFLAYRIYMGFVQPLRFIANGVGALEDKDFSVRYQKTGSRELDQLIKVYNNLIDNIREERVQLQEQHYFLQRLIQVYPAAVIILDFDEKITDFNPKAEEIFNVPADQVLQRTLANLDHPLIPLLVQMEAGSDQLVKIKGTERYKCEVAQFLHRGFYRKFILIQEVSREILQAEKEAYGKVIRMMAHEVNNSIGATNSILDTVQTYLQEKPGEENSEMAAALALAIQRHHSLNQFMQNFARVVRLPKPELDWVEIPAFLQRVAQLMQPSLIAAGVQLDLVFDPSLSLKKRIDERQMEQVLLNLLKNAKEAIREKGKVRIELKAQPLEIVISDNGKGIDAEVKDQLFTPFFSTKPDGQGVGLTLVREIIHNHNASIDLESRPDGWTYCTIRF